jgi:TIR domain
MQVFLSYAHTPADSALVTYIDARLRAAGFTVWRDQSNLPAGQLLQDAIEKAIAASDHGVFIVSPSWLQREWTAFELEQFARRDPTVVRRIPVLRSPHDQLTVPPRLVKIKAFEWLEGDSQPDSRMWELYCAIKGDDPGPQDAWEDRGHTLPAVDPKLYSPPPPPPPMKRPSLLCDRAPQWKTVDDLAVELRNELVIVPGAVGQDHEHFLQRIEWLLRHDPPRSIVRIDWPTWPHSRDEFREALGRALAVPATELASDMSHRLANSNLLLLHPCVRSQFVSEPLIAYYTKWLPELITECRPTKNVKCVQPVEWPPEPRGFGRLVRSLSRPASWLSRPAPDDDESRPRAEELIQRFLSGAAPLLRAVRLRELGDLTPDDLDDFCQIVALGTKQRTWLLEHIGSRNARTPKDIFQAIDDFLPYARNIT